MAIAVARLVAVAEVVGNGNQDPPVVGDAIEPRHLRVISERAGRRPLLNFDTLTLSVGTPSLVPRVAGPRLLFAPKQDQEGTNDD